MVAEDISAAGAVRGFGTGGTGRGGMLGDPTVGITGIEVGGGCCPISMSVPTVLLDGGKGGVAPTAGGEVAWNGLVEGALDIGGGAMDIGGGAMDSGGCC